MDKLIGVRIPFLKQISYIKSKEDYKPGEYVVINSNNGEYVCEVATHLETKNLMHSQLKNTYVKELASDDVKLQNIEAFESMDKFASVVKLAIKELKLPITYLGVWPSIDRKFIKIYYYTNEMIKFGEVISFILKKYNQRVRIEMVQVGTREYHGLIGGVGICGYELCCHSRHYSAPAITSETIRYIGYRITLKDQLIGSCSKYKCCLLYEAEEYRRYLKHLPNFGTKITYENKKYNIADINIFTKQITIVNRYDRIDLPFSYFIKQEEE